MSKLFITALAALCLLSACATNDDPQVSNSAPVDRSSANAANTAATMMSPLTSY